MAKIYESEGTIWIKEEPHSIENEGPEETNSEVKEEPAQDIDDYENHDTDSACSSQSEVIQNQKINLKTSCSLESKKLSPKKEYEEDEEKKCQKETKFINKTSENSEEFSKISSTSAESNKTYSCSRCEYVAPQSLDLIEHINAIHSTVNSISWDKNHSSSQEKPIIYWAEKPISCKHCDYTCKTRGELKHHLLSQHKGLKILYCPQCDYTTKYSTRLKNHIMAKHTKEKPLSCPFCNYCAVQTSNLKNHITAKHVTMQTLSCPQCPFTCAESSVLLCHMAQHKKN